MNFRTATLEDCTLLAELNHQLIRDEGHRNRILDVAASDPADFEDCKARQKPAK